MKRINKVIQLTNQLTIREQVCLYESTHNMTVDNQDYSHAFRNINPVKPRLTNIHFQIY